MIKEEGGWALLQQRRSRWDRGLVGAASAGVWLIALCCQPPRSPVITSVGMDFISVRLCRCETGGQNVMFSVRF